MQAYRYNHSVGGSQAYRYDHLVGRSQAYRHDHSVSGSQAYRHDHLVGRSQAYRHDHLVGGLQVYWRDQYRNSRHNGAISLSMVCGSTVPAIGLFRWQYNASNRVIFRRQISTESCR